LRSFRVAEKMACTTQLPCALGPVRGRMEERLSRAGTPINEKQKGACEGTSRYLGEKEQRPSEVQPPFNADLVFSRLRRGSRESSSEKKITKF